MTKLHSNYAHVKVDTHRILVGWSKEFWQMKIVFLVEFPPFPYGFPVKFPSQISILLPFLMRELHQKELLLSEFLVRQYNTIQYKYLYYSDKKYICIQMT